MLSAKESMKYVEQREKQHVARRSNASDNFVTIFTRSIQLPWKIISFVTSLCLLARTTLSPLSPAVVLILPKVLKNAHSVDQNSMLLEMTSSSRNTCRNSLKWESHAGVSVALVLPTFTKTTV
mmetsp:Transcript_20173/g.36627  ORF Transcript_20173/g.36627 Transcript_20173/m.36627 type:complete len:123 (-) Transcript_20173:285-653(-)